LGNLATPKSVQKLQTALHAKAKAEAGYRFYTLYDKISRDDVLAHAYAQCRSNRGAPGIDGQDFADIEAYGVERWLTELALALRQESYRPEPIRRVFIPKANGKLRPLGISSVVSKRKFEHSATCSGGAREASFPVQGRSTQRLEVRCWTILHKDRRARPADGRRWIALRPLVSKSIGRQQSQISAFYH